MSEPPIPSLGIILATDRYETIRPVIRHLQRQTIRDQLEIVMVGDASLPGGLDAAELAGFARVHVETVDSIDPISAARAPLVFIGETHTYAHPTWAEALVRAQADGRAGLIPGFGNANPAGPLSWAIFLLDYGRWLYLMPARESAIAPTHNGAFRREVLLDLGENLDHALHQGDRLTLLLQSANHRMYFEPFCGAPLIPMLLVVRLREVLAVASQGGLLPRGTLAAVFLGGTVSAVGEMFGYLVGDRPDVEPQMMEFELHKVLYAARGAAAAG